MRKRKVGSLGAGFVGVAVGICLDAKRLTQAEALPHQHEKVAALRRELRTSPTISR
jgi:hypothetical protein